MKLVVNLFVFLFVLMIPFALSSQTRKAIPSGRYEALSGIKSSHAGKIDSAQNEINQSGFWQEVLKNLPKDKNEVYFMKQDVSNFNISQYIPSKVFREAKKIDKEVELFVTSDLKKAKDFLKNGHGYGISIVMTSQTVKEIVNLLADEELVIFQAQSNRNFYLLKAK